MSSREKFEQVMKEKFDNLIDYRVCKNGDGEYMAWDMQVAWFAWQAATNAMEAKCAALAAENAGLASEVQSVKAMNDCLSEELRGYESDGAFEGPKMHLLWWKVQTPATDAFLADVRAQGVDALVERRLTAARLAKEAGHEITARDLEGEAIRARFFAMEIRKGVQS